MEQEPHVQPAEGEPQPSPDQPAPPPFDPDPRLVTYLERGAKSDAEERFRADTEKRAAGRGR
ncbi:MAG: hypothetical protein AB1551_08705 [Actinomycetota bacterium]